MKAIERVSVSDMIVANLKEHIMSGEFQVDDKFYPEQRISQELSVSRASVREALRVLHVMGYLDLRPGRGAFVARIKEPEKNEIIRWIRENKVRFMDVMETRKLLEVYAVKQAILRCSDEDIASISEMYDRFAKAVRDKDLAAMISCDEKFHSLIFKMTNNHVLCSIYKQLKKFVDEFRSKSFALDDLYANALEPHRNIVEAFKARDAALGEQVMQEHMEITARDMIAVAEDEK